MKEIEFESDGLTLRGKVFYPDNQKEKNPAILFIQGWTGVKENSFQYAAGLAKLGYICFVFDSRGHGESEGDINTATTEEFTRDDLAAYDFFISLEGVDKDRVSVVGSSFGGYRAAYLISKRPINNLVLRASADYANEGFKIPRMKAGGSEVSEVLEWRKQARKPNETWALQAVHNFNGNILIIESEIDEHVPHQTIQNYRDAIKDESKLKYVFMKGAPHSIKEGPFRDEVERIYTDWFKNLKG